MGESSLISKAIDRGGAVYPLLIDSDQTQHLPLCNPSILELEKDSKYLLNLRWIAYYLHHCEEEQKYQTPWGPLCYVRPDNDPVLRTENYVCDLDLESMQAVNPRKIDTRFFEEPTPWDFVGLEDVRLTAWNGNVYGSGVRRFAPDGKGRTQISKLDISKKIVTESERFFVETPIDKESYCEKNWMPILDKPFQFVKWCCPTEVVQANVDNIPETSHAYGSFCSSSVINFVDNRFVDSSIINHNLPQKGGSQIVSYKNYYIAVTHESENWHNHKNDRDASYYHRFLVWDKKWNLIKATDRFKFMHGKIEFCCGMASYKDSFLITFGFQDNSAFLFKMPKVFFDEYVGI